MKPKLTSCYYRCDLYACACFLISHLGSEQDASQFHLPCQEDWQKDIRGAVWLSSTPGANFLYFFFIFHFFSFSLPQNVLVCAINAFGAFVHALDYTWALFSWETDRQAISPVPASKAAVLPFANCPFTHTISTPCSQSQATLFIHSLFSSCGCCGFGRLLLGEPIHHLCPLCCFSHPPWASLGWRLQEGYSCLLISWHPATQRCPTRGSLDSCYQHSKSALGLIIWV